MNVMKAASPAYYTEAQCDLEEFASLNSSKVSKSDIPNAVGAPKNVPVYDMDVLRPALDGQESRQDLMAEWGRVLQRGAGVLVLKQAYDDTTAID